MDIQLDFQNPSSHPALPKLSNFDLLGQRQPPLAMKPIKLTGETYHLEEHPRMDASG